MNRRFFSPPQIGLGVALFSLLTASVTPASAQQPAPAAPTTPAEGAPAAPAEGRGRGPGRGARGPVAPRFLETKILDYYDVENIDLPPGLTNTDGIAVMPDGRLVVCFQSGQVYFYTAATKEWKLFAEGLHWPLGVLPVSNTEILVMQAPELTLVADRNGDGKAEVFRSVSDDFGMSGNYAEFHAGPVKDPQGNLFYSLGTGSHFGAPLTNEVRGFFSEVGAVGRMTSPVPYRGWVMRVSPDGKTTPWAVGLREPNGLGLDPKGRVFAIDNQGDWVGASALYHIEEGKFYGHVPPLAWRKDFQGKFPLDLPVEELDKLRTRAAVVFPYGEMANSPTQPLWDNTGGKFGPFAGQMFIGEMNFRRIMRVMLEDVGGQVQGAVTPFLEAAKLRLGNVRLAFGHDGSLYVGQTFHPAWTGESGLQRITWKGVVPLEVRAMKVTETGFNLAFTRPVDAAIAGNPETYAMKTYFYNYHEAYGSSKFDLKDVKVTSAVVAPDRLSVALQLENLEAWRIYDLKFNGLKTTDGHELVNSWVVYTLNQLAKGASPPRAPIVNPKPPRRPPAIPKGGVRGIGGPQDFK